MSDAKTVHWTDQRIADAKLNGAMIGAFYKELLASGLERGDALYLTNSAVQISWYPRKPEQQ